MQDKKGDMVLADVFAIIFTVLVLIMIVAFSFMGDFLKRDNKLEIDDVDYGNENIFVIESYLRMNSDLVNSYVLDENNKELLENNIKELFGKIYGSCYGFEFKDIKVNSLSDKKTCVDYPIDNKLCLDISEYDKKMESQEVAKCFE